MSSSCKKCGDEIFGVIKVRGQKIDFRRCKNYQTTFWPPQTYLNFKQTHPNLLARAIVLILESPHIDEFKVTNIINAESKMCISARPVNGASGLQIQNKISQLLNCDLVNLENGNYPLIIVNAIQLQCSKGAKPLLHRTREFLRLWPNYKNDFIERMQILNPTLIINACTTGDFYLDPQNSQFSAYKSGPNGGSFKHNFKLLIENEFHYKSDTDAKDLIFTNSLDLSGLVMTEIDKLYGLSNCKILKTSHPAAWIYRAPKLQTYKKDLHYHFSL